MQKKIKSLVLLQILLLMMSLSGVCSKLAAGEDFLSLPWCLYYGGVIGILGVYAIGWQQVIKHIPLTVAYACKAVGVVWNILWAILFFRETITAGKVIGAALVITGVVLFSTAGDDHEG